MCESNQYTWVYPDGCRKKQPLETVYLCPNARHARPCAENTIYRHPARPAPSYSTSAPSPSSSPSFLAPNQFPPTPNYTPRSATPNYHSGNETDRSYHSSNGSGSAPRRSRSHRTPRVYINGQEVYSSSSPSRSRERYVLSSTLPPPSSPRPNHSAPSSPSTPYVYEANTSSHRRRTTSGSHHTTAVPVIVHERPHVEIDIRQPRRMHTRNPSSSEDERAGLSSSSSSSRHQRSRKERTAERIAQANAQIASRPPVPRASTTREEQLADAMRRLELKEEQRQRRRAQKEEEEQTERLRERLSRRATQHG